ncbi:MAG: ion channel [Alphaproteobacteria bacterium]
MNIARRKRAKREKQAAPPAAHAKRLRRSRGLDGISNVIWLGTDTSPRRDLYAWFLTLPWRGVLGLCAGGYLVINALFALVYLADPGGIGNARPGSFADAFFFSVQTMATIGYGNMYPTTLFANLVVTAETTVGLLSFALITGLLFTRFSRPSARVLFSDVAVIAPYDGVPTLIFRMANERRNVILQAEVRVTLLRSEKTQEGTEIQRQRDLKLIRHQSSFFGLSWMVGHPIDAESPLRGETAESLGKCGAVIGVLLAGTDETLGQTVHARYTYPADRILWDRRFVDVLGRTAEGERVIDLRHFHETVPV